MSDATKDQEKNSQFVIELPNANEATHADTPPDVTAVTGLYERACELLRDLFGPVSLRLSEMDDLVGLQDLARRMSHG